MMKQIARFSVEYPITVLMLVLAVLLLGFISFQKLGMDLFPDLNNPRIFVELSVGERPPEEIEQQFVQHIESLAIQQKNAVGVSSISRTGMALITVEYAWDTDMDNAYLDLQKSLNSYAQNEDIDEITISQHDPNAAPIIVLALSHPEITDMDELRQISESYLRNELIRLEGIADVQLLGYEEKEVVVETDDYLMEAYGVTPSVLTNRIESNNSNVSGGSLVEMGTKYVIKGIGEFRSLEDIGQLIVTYETVSSTGENSNTVDRAPVYLKDIAEISLKNKDPENIVRVNGKRCVALAIYKETRYNTVNTVEAFFNELDTLRKALPGYDLTVIQNKGSFITNAVDEVKETALIGIIFAVIVLFVFLRQIGTTLVISFAIPISIVATFNLMYFKGLSLNIMTLGGLALGAGMLVDNAIVVMENIFRNRESGMTLVEAAVQGTAQVGGAIIASTLTTIVVFLPIVYLHGTAGELFKEQAWTVAFALLSSMVVAILVIPMLCTKLLKSGHKTKNTKESVKFPRYRRFLSGALKKRWLVILGAVVLVAIAIRLIPVVGSEFIPKTDLNEYTIGITLPEGTDLFRTSNVAQGIEAGIRELFPESVSLLYSIIGPDDTIDDSSESSLSDENTAEIVLVLDAEKRIPSTEVYRRLNTLLEAIPDLEATVTQEQTAIELTLGTDTAPLIVEIAGEDLDIVQELTARASEALSQIEDLYNIETNFDEGRAEVQVEVDRVRAGLNDISLSTIASSLENILSGVNAGSWDDDGELRDITIKLPEVQLSQLEDIMIESGDEKIPLYEVADIAIGTAPKEIYRSNQERIGEITANLSGVRPLDHVVAEIEEVIDGLSFPPDYKVRISGEEHERREAFNNLKFALILSLVLVYMVLASQFESLLHPFTILLSIPLAAVGAILIFFFMGMSLNIMAYIGIIMLVGIAVNDSIILVDAINQLKRDGMSAEEAILDAGQQRIRPIIMTSLTTILALLPLTFGFGEGAALRAPMALAVIGGLITSTILTLAVIPCVYYVMDNIGNGRKSMN